MYRYPAFTLLIMAAMWVANAALAAAAAVLVLVLFVVAFIGCYIWVCVEQRAAQRRAEEERREAIAIDPLGRPLAELPEHVIQRQCVGRLNIGDYLVLRGDGHCCRITGATWEEDGSLRINYARFSTIHSTRGLPLLQMMEFIPAADVHPERHAPRWNLVQPVRL